MKKIGIFAVIISFLFALNSCEKAVDIDNKKPEIDLSIQDAFPVSCDTLYFGETFILKIKFTDNVQLGSYSIDIHNNFDHHSHSTEITECSVAPVKTAVNPFTFIEDYDIDKGLKAYETNISITIPTGNTTGLFDDGDYHFFISLTDKEGWSTQKGLSIKILHRWLKD